MSLHGQVAIVTGGSRGIGRAIVEALLLEGVAVVFNGRNDVVGHNAEQEMKMLGGPVRYVRGDVTRSEDVKSLVTETLDEHGRLDILVNNAGGITNPALTHEMSDEDWHNDIVLNLSSAFYGTKYALPSMLRAGRGRIVNISSTSGKLPRPAMSGYVSGKHGLLGLTKNVAAEVGPHGVTVNAVLPGQVITEFVIESAPRVAKALGVSVADRQKSLDTPLGRPVTVGEVVAVVMLLVSDHGSGINGASISVDGGVAPY